jgi:hypothetical protein
MVGASYKLQVNRAANLYLEQFMDIEKSKFVRDVEDSGNVGGEEIKEDLDDLEFETLIESTILVRLCDSEGSNFYLRDEEMAEMLIPRVTLVFNGSSYPT